ncbi:MAG: hypothetical protein K8T20_08685 [Planctomycetes bacterium]|nr:hypothetical protein [Planctomycetota bacterium]
MNHPRKETMTLLAYGFLTASEEAAAREHLAQCAACKAEWTAARGEATAVKAAFEPAPVARPRLVAWWPAAAGFAAALLGGMLIHAFSGGGKASETSPRPVSERRAGTLANRVPSDGLELRYRGEGTTYTVRGPADWRLEDGIILVENLGPARAKVETPVAEVFLEVGARAWVRSNPGETSVLLYTGYAQAIAAGETVNLKSGDAIAVVPGQAPVLLRESDDSAARLSALRDRIAALEHSVAALRNNAADPESPEAVGNWLAKQAAQGRMMGVDQKVGEELGRLWSRVIRESGVTPAELEAGTAREKLIAGYLEGRGCPLSPEKRHVWDVEIASHDQAAQQYLQSRQELSGLEKALALARVAAGRGPRYAALLDDAQKKALAELDPAFRDWRQGFASVFKVVVGVEGPDKALEQVGMMSGGMSDVAKEIERSLLDGCLALHRDADPTDPAAEQVALLELLVKTRDRLVKDAGLAPARANGLLVNFVEGAKK